MKLYRGFKEEQLIKGCKRGERSAQKKLYEKYYGKMLTICMRYASDKDEAVAILNDAFLKVFNNIANYRGDGALGAWMGRITFYTAINHIRKNSSYKKSITLDSEEDGVFEHDVLDDLSAAEIMDMIQELNPGSRNVFSLYIIEGYSHKEIAEMLDIPIGTSKWHLSNARKELQKMIGEKGLIYNYG